MSHITSATPPRHPKDPCQAPPKNGNPTHPKTTSKPASSRRRDKPQLSCNHCRRRKSKCDRQRPCSHCSTRNLSCAYPENLANMTPSGPSSAGLSVHERIVQLERLVMSVIPDPAQKPNGHPIANVATLPELTPVEIPVGARSECGSMRIDDSELQYVGGDHWVAILDGIADLKDQLDREEQLRLAQVPLDGVTEHVIGNNADVANAQPSGAFLLYGCRPASREEILSSLPPKHAVDRYVSRYFNYLDLVASAAVHGPSFLREYHAFWLDTSSAPIIWVGLLFSMICLACLASEPLEGSEADALSLQIHSYREKTVQCLTLGKYTKPGPYVLETVINYVYVEFGINPDANKDMWFLLALEVNLAKRMGYHRDPSHFSGISPFQGEMRRRLWATVLMSDVLISNQMGMQRMISDWQYDTLEPRNLNDDEFDKDTTELPSSRSETELTTTLGIIARTRMLKALGTIADIMDAVKPWKNSEVMRVDRILHEAVESIPFPLKMKPMAASLTDSPQVIVARLFIKHMFFKGQIMLHRRFCYMSSPQNQIDSSYSQRACLDASIGSLEIQHILDEETRPGGQLCTMRWRVTSIMNHQFLTATMFLCSLLYPGRAVEREDETRTALLKARTIWIRRSSFSKEAQRAADTVSLVLSRASEDGKSIGKSTRGVQAQRLRQVPTAKVANAGPGSEDADMLPVAGPMDLHGADQLAMPDFMATLMPSDLHDPNSSFDILDQTMLPDGWMAFVDWPESG
ncbi:hypothetical protein BDV06DRAFT_173420 [Aspergillus oleicola]